MALRTGAVERLRGIPSPEILLRTLLLHIARGYSLRETAVLARLANWVDVSDVALLKRLRNSEEWLRSLCLELLRENGAYSLENDASKIRIVDGTIVKEPGKTGSQWRILYSLTLPSLVCDFFEITHVIGEGTGESFNRLTVVPHELVLADAGYCSTAGIEYVQHQGADVLVRVNPQSFVAYSPDGRRISLLTRLRSLSKTGQYGEWRVVLHARCPGFRAGCAQYGRVIRRFSRLIDACTAPKYVFGKFVGKVVFGLMLSCLNSARNSSAFLRLPAR